MHDASFNLGYPKKLIRPTILGFAVTFAFTMFALRKNGQKYHFNFEGIRLNDSRPFIFNRNLLPPLDYNLLIGINVHFVTLNSPCKQTAPLLLILVHTSADNFPNRKTIRETWGLNNEEVVTLFMLGTSTSPVINSDVIRENELFQDIIQGSFMEDYNNLSYKHAMSLKYSLYHCPQAKYVLRIDDDVLVNTPRLVNFLKTNLSEHGAEKCLICKVNRRAGVLRSYSSKWRMSFDEYPQRYYPTYCQGWHVLYSMDVIFQLYKELQRHSYFRMEDVLVTGMVVDKIKYVNHSDSTALTYLHNRWWSRPPEDFLFGGIEWDMDYIRKIWMMLHQSGNYDILLEP